MAEHKTKYNIGDKVFIIRERDGYFYIELEPISRIVIGGKAFEEYKVGSYSYAERDLFTNFEEAKERALEEQKKFGEKTKTHILDQKPPFSYNG